MRRAGGGIGDELRGQRASELILVGDEQGLQFVDIGGETAAAG
jgi:hypothetical protein